MPYMCLTCFQIYDDSIEKTKTIYRGKNNEWIEVISCPKADCLTGEVVYIDELILPVIKLLNEKGYRTKHCCSGHIYNENDCYVIFEAYVKELPNIPEGFSLTKGEDDCLILSYDFNNKVWSKERYKNILAVNNRLFEWAEKLPKNHIGVILY